MKKIYLFTLILLCSAALVDAQKLVREDFESGVAPSTWTIDSEWEVGTNDQLLSQFFNPDGAGIYMIYNDDAAGGGAAPADVSFTTEAFDLTTATSATLLFDLYYNDVLYAGGQENATIEITTDGGTTWTEIADLATTEFAWVKQEIDLSGYVGGMAMLRGN